ncbi:DNA-processing protein DprA [Nocardia beijingensis]|uniref:DNA-processing protein DprA n=1 Tax=Nocardia beijingensis TaxID=95162 RepID=UPI00332ED463
MIPASQSPSRRLAWAILARAALTAAPVVRELLHALGAEEAAARLTTGQDAAADLPRDLRGLAARDLDRAEALDIRLLTRDDAEWPGEAGLSDLDAPGITDGSPVALWVRGTPRLIPLSHFTVAVVGARAASEYGVHVTHDLAGDLAERGWTVISGGAFGIDAAAHRAALNRGGRTIAVVATGLGRAYPAAHRELFDRIAETGLLLSEYPPDTPAAKHHFLQRNRLVAALSSAVVIPECALRGGTRNTANWARQLNLAVLAVPGPIYSAASRGCHELIRAGHARLVTDAQQVIDNITSTPLPPHLADQHTA